MEIVLPPKSEHATYDPPVLGHLGMRPELVVREPTTSASGSRSSRTCGSGRCSST